MMTSANNQCTQKR